MQGRTRRPSASLVIAALALAVAFAGGGQAIAKGAAAAAKLITGKQIKDGSLTLADFKASERAKLRGPAGANGAAGATGPKGDTGAAGAPGAAGAAGTARAYGLVGPSGTLTRSKGIAAVTSPTTGVYCVRLDAAIDASAVEAVASLNFPATSAGATIQVNANRNGCPGVANFVEIMTGQIQSTALGTNVTEVFADQGFYVVVP